MSSISGQKVDPYQAELPYKQISFSDPECIKRFIKNRWMIDPYFELKGTSLSMHANQTSPFNQEIICLYADLDQLIAKAKLKDKQQKIVLWLMQGWSEEDIAAVFHNQTSTIHRTLQTIILKIKAVNDREWKYNFIYRHYLKAPWEYKQCKKCQETLPKIEQFFTTSKNSKDGFHSYCKACNK